MSQLVNIDDLGTVMEKVVINGDLSPLTPDQRTVYYRRICESLGLNPLTKPFAYIKLQGKLTLYALRDAADQLRKNQGISIEIVSRTIEKGILTVHVRAKSKDGRTDEDLSAIPWSSGFKADDQANLIMKAITKAKRRVTLSICGLGILDESEIVGLPDAQIVGPDGHAPTDQSEPDRKTAYFARKEGLDKAFQIMAQAIRKSGGPVECQEIWKTNGEMLSVIPGDWFTNIAEEFVEKMQKHGVSIDVDEHGWPVLPQVNEAA